MAIFSVPFDITPGSFSVRPILLACTDARGCPAPGTELYFSLLIVMIYSYDLNEVYFLNLLQSSAQTDAFVTVGLFVYTFKNLLILLNFLCRIWYKESKHGVSDTLDLKIYIRSTLLKISEKERQS